MLRDWVERKILTLEIVLIILSLIVSISLQIIIYIYDLANIIEWKWVHNLYNWIISSDSLELLNAIDGFAAAFGIISFFLDKWLKNDTENIVYVLILTISLVLAHIFKATNLHVISFFLALTAIVLLIIPCCFSIQDNLNSSTRRTENRNKVKYR